MTHRSLRTNVIYLSAALFSSFMLNFVATPAAAAPVTPSYGWSTGSITVPDGQPDDATWSETPYTGVGEHLYTGSPNTWYDPPTVVRVQGNYIDYGTDLNEPFAGMNYYFYAGNIQDGTAVTDFNINLDLPGLAESFTFELALQDNSNGTQELIIIGDTADATITYTGVEYSLVLLGFSTDNGQTITNSLLIQNGQVATGNFYFQLVPTTVPTPTAASLGLASLALLMLRKRKH
ncbi:hypothetical protein [Poriferisphaera sp. WC338]|uniref:hypothetical protein n=1 Tax=Poriferisphaera sp. WC338 TaxID=3425129 RepID=UPI003D815444